MLPQVSAPRRRVDLVSTIVLSIWTLTVPGSSVSADEVPSSPFVRGDANASGQIDVSDGIAVLQHLFGGDTLPPCHAAADVNGDAVLDVADGISLFTFLFLGRAMPPPPYPDCGYPENPEGSLDCQSFEPCESYTVLAGAAPPPPSEPVHVACLGGDVAPPVALEPELYEALVHLAPGEPILALRGLPGFRDYMEQTRVFTGVPPYPWSGDDYTPTVSITVESNEDEPCFEPSQEVLDSVRESLVAQEVLDPAVPLETIDPPRVCGEGEHPVLLETRKSDGTAELRSCLIKVLKKPGATKPVQVEVRSPPPDAGPRLTDKFRCEWGTASYVLIPALPTKEKDGRTWNIFGHGITQKFPDDESEDCFGCGRDGWYIFHGGGPWLDILAKRWAANCHSPPTAISCTGKGLVRMDVKLICSDDASRVGVPPCKSLVHAEALYESDLEVSSESGLWCHFFGANDVEAFAQSEARFEVNDDVKFNKAMAVANGNNVTTEVSYEFGANLTKEDGPFVGAKLGYREIIDHDTGQRSDALSCTAIAQAEPVPSTLKLWSKGIARLNAYNATVGSANVETTICGLWFVGESACPEAGKIAGAYLVGIPENVRARQKEAEAFLKGRGYVGPIDWGVPAKTDKPSDASAPKTGDSAPKPEAPEEESP